MKNLTQYINESMDRINKLVDKAVEEMTDFVIDTIDYEFLNNATDIKRCKPNDISRMLDLANDDYFRDSKVFDEPFSIMELLKKYKHISCASVIDDIVSDNWQDELDDNLVDALHDYFDVGGIVNKKALNGGSFEAFRDFQMAVEYSVVNKIIKNIR